MILARNKLSKLGMVGAILLATLLIDSDPGKGKEIPTPLIQDFSIATQLLLKPVNIKAKSQGVVAALANGNYQFCSQPEPQDWRQGAGVCFNFRKVDRSVDGYYGYPHSDRFICLKGKVNGELITGEALEISWAGNQWSNVPTSAFKWDSEGRLLLNQGTIIRTSKEGNEQTDWIVFRSASLNVSGFYQYSRSRMTLPSQLCDWSMTVD